LEAPDAVNLDLLGAGFVGSVGVNALIQVRRLAADEGVKFWIVKASRRVESVLDLMGLAEQFE